MNLNCYTPTNRLARALFPEWSDSQEATAERTPFTLLGQDKDNHYVQIDLPGVRKDDVKIQVEAAQLLVTAERKVDFNGQQHSYNYRRSFTLPENVNRETIRAEQKDGVLTLTLPKKEEAKPRQIDISVA
jgi:HSP20 family protein